jgi:hypothetical protein
MGDECEFNETLIFADFLKKTCERKSIEQRGSTVFPLLFFPRGRIRTTRREKKNQNLLKNRQTISFRVLIYEFVETVTLLLSSLEGKCRGGRKSRKWLITIPSLLILRASALP